MASFSILMKDKVIYTQSRKEKRDKQEPWETKIERGELLVEIPDKERASQGNGTAHNYRLYSNTDLSLYADGMDATPVKERELGYILAVTPPNLRTREFVRSDRMKMATSLIVSEAVMFKMKVGAESGPDDMVRGVIRYIGEVPKRGEGIYFGIEITVS